MKKILTSDTFLGIIASIIFSLIIIAALLLITSPEVWYAGMHDSQCEGIMLDEGEDCGCYERFLATEKSRK